MIYHILTKSQEKEILKLFITGVLEGVSEKKHLKLTVQEIAGSISREILEGSPI